VGKGSGQGLAIAQHVIVDKHNGTIAVESKEGDGTTFVITLPLTVAQAEKTHPKKVENEGHPIQ